MSHAFRLPNSAGRTYQTAEVAADAAGADKARTATVVVEDDCLVTTVATRHLTTAAADAHMLISAETFVVVIDLVEGLIPHHLLRQLAGNIAAGCLREVLDHAGRPDSPALALAAVLLVQVIQCLKAAAGAADGVAASAGDTVLADFLPHGKIRDFL